MDILDNYIKFLLLYLQITYLYVRSTKHNYVLDKRELNFKDIKYLAWVKNLLYLQPSHDIVASQSSIPEHRGGTIYGRTHLLCVQNI